MKTFRYTGEQELVVPFTVEGPRVVSQGNVITVGDADESLDHRQDFEQVPHGTPDTPSMPPALGSAPTPQPQPEPQPDPQPEASTEVDSTPVPDEPTA